MPSWIALQPQWFLREVELLDRHYPGVRIDERRLDDGTLLLWGELKVRPPGGAHAYPVAVLYQDGTPFEHPMVFPIRSLPDLDASEPPKIEPTFFDRRHQMPRGNLCLFQRDTRTHVGGDVVDICQVLRRAERWFIGLHTSRWPPDTVESELEAHFTYASDVLLAARFFEADVRGHGRFYMIPDLRRVIDRSPVYEDSCPMIVTAMTEESGIVKVLDARAELSDIYPWIDSGAWDPNKLASVTDRNVGELGQPEQGYWWSLPSEPAPFRDGDGLLAVLAQVAAGGDSWNTVTDALGGEMAVADRHYFALQFPGRTGGVEWLFLVMPHKVRRAGGGIVIGGNKRREFGGLGVFCYRTHPLRVEDLWHRNRTVIDDAVRGKSVAMIGLARLGSRVAELLAQAGVGQLFLCDSDRLKPANVARHIGGVSDFGASKVPRVVISRLQDINPRLRFREGDMIVGSAVASLARLSEFISRADLVISTVADENVESVINQVALVTGRPVLYGRSLRSASMGRVFLVRPGKDACKSCLASYAHRSREGGRVPEDWIDIPEGDSEVLLHECGRPVIAGSAADLSFVAALTGRVAIDFLEGKLGDSNHWVWSRCAATDLDERLATPLSTFSGKLPPSKTCPACLAPPITEVLIDDAMHRFIVSATEASPKVETGGVLIGHIDERRRAVVTRATEPGPKAVRSAGRFQRDVEYTQREIDRFAQELGEKGVYIGEWHSHLDPSPEPSPTDVRSLNGIVAAPRYLTAAPVMVIAGFDPATGRAAAIRSWVFVPGGRFHRVPNNTEIDAVEPQ